MTGEIWLFKPPVLGTSIRRDYTRSMAEMGRLLVIVGIALAVIGGIVMLLGRTAIPLGRLPGDIVYRGKNTTFYFPLATSIALSVLLSLILFLVNRFKR
ncbi:MAG: DUF2905 domain-containing protein [Terriglobales bacterium]